MTKRREASVSVTGNEKALEQAEFSAAAKEIDEVLREADKAFRDLGLGTSGAVEVLREDAGGDPDEWPPQPEYQHCVYLAFGKRQGKWQLHIESGVDGDGDTWGTADLWSQSLDIRVRAIRALPQLLSALQQARHKKLEDLREAAASGRAFLATLKQVKADA